MGMTVSVESSTPMTGRAFAETLPGITAPMGYFDPMNLLEDKSPEEILMFREAELAHCRVSMVAALGFLVQENFHPIFPDVGGPGARQLTEIQRAKIGWMDPEEAMQELKPGYVPGELGFDPLGMAPKTEEDMMKMKNKELNNGRLAMMAIAGIVAQEVVTGQELLGSA